MSGQRNITVSLVVRTTRALEHAAYLVRRLAWDLRHDPVSDVERLALRWALVHIRAGRTDLAVEDFAWLGSRR